MNHIIDVVVQPYDSSVIRDAMHLGAQGSRHVDRCIGSRHIPNEAVGRYTIEVSSDDFTVPVDAEREGIQRARHVERCENTGGVPQEPVSFGASCATRRRRGKHEDDHRGNQDRASRRH